MNRQNIFLIDGLGAAYSALMLSVVLPALVGFFGMPVNVLYPLTLAALCLAIYSLPCHFSKFGSHNIFLFAVAFLNFTYCCVSSVILYAVWDSVTIWGVLYFLNEKLVVLFIAYCEFELARGKAPNLPFRRKRAS